MTFKCYLIDPLGQSVRNYKKDSGEDGLISSIQNSISQLQLQIESFNSLNLKGSLEIYLYDRLPTFYLMCIDPLPENARMTVSHYMPGILCADTPVIQFSKKSNPELYKKYWLSLQDLTNSAKFIVRISKDQA